MRLYCIVWYYALMYGMVLYVTVFYCIVLRYTLMCQNDYPLGLGSLKPNPSACHYRDQAMLQVLTIIFLFIVTEI